MAFLAGLIPALLGGIAGATNPRPPALDPTQRGSLDQLIKSLMPNATGTPKIDPVQQNLMYGNIAQNQTGGMDAVTHALVSRGLGHSGLLGGALTQVANQAQQGRNQADLGLQQQAVQQKQLSIQDILGLLGVSNIPGQSGVGAFFSGMAGPAAYSIQNMLNNRSGGGGGSSNFTTPGGFWSGNS
jgi:hypothetical protein